MKEPSLVPETSASANSAILAGGRGWIRTTEVCDGRFTVCSLWPLGNPSIDIWLFFFLPKNWSWRWDLNPQPSDYKSDALPIELHQHRQSVSRWPSRIDPTPSIRKKMATRKGLEPSTSSVTGWHSNQLNYRTAWWEQQGSNL